MKTKTAIDYQIEKIEKYLDVELDNDDEEELFFRIKKINNSKNLFVFFNDKNKKSIYYSKTKKLYYLKFQEFDQSEKPIFIKNYFAHKEDNDKNGDYIIFKSNDPRIIDDMESYFGRTYKGLYLLGYYQKLYKNVYIKKVCSKDGNKIIWKDNKSFEISEEDKKDFWTSLQYNKDNISFDLFAKYFEDVDSGDEEALMDEFDILVHNENEEFLQKYFCTYKELINSK